MDCPLPTVNATALEARRWLAQAKTIAVIGLSPEPHKVAHQVARFLQQVGYRIIPIYPTTDAPILGETVYACLDEVPEEIIIDIVDVFRRPVFLPEIAQQTVKRGAKVLWMQLGIVNDQAAHIALAGGVQVVQNRCTKMEYLAHSTI